MDVQMKRGFLEGCVLAVLLEEDSYGYKIIRKLSGRVEMTESTLYPILRRLESAGALTAYSIEHGGRLRKYYRITDAGRARIGEFLRDWETISQTYEYIKEEFDKYEKKLNFWKP